MSDHTERGKADHKAVELYERLAKLAGQMGLSPEMCEMLITASVMEAMAGDWWQRRGYTMPPRD